MTGGASNYLKATGFGYGLPANAVIGGIYVQWDRKSLSAIGLMDNAVRIVKDDVVQSADDRPPTCGLAPSEPEQYGGPTDLCGRAVDCRGYQQLWLRRRTLGEVHH